MRLTGFFKRRKIWTPDAGVTFETKMSDLAPFNDYLKPSTVAELKKAAEGSYGDPWGMTVGELLTFMRGDFSAIGVSRSDTDMKVLQFYWIESFREMAEALEKTFKALQPPQPKGAVEFSKACKPMTFEESSLVFLRDYFHLHTFEEARRLPISDLLLAKKDRYNQAAFEKARSDYYERQRQSKK